MFIFWLQTTAKKGEIIYKSYCTCMSFQCPVLCEQDLCSIGYDWYSRQLTCSSKEHDVRRTLKEASITDINQVSHLLIGKSHLSRSKIHPSICVSNLQSWYGTLYFKRVYILTEKSRIAFTAYVYKRHFLPRDRVFWENAMAHSFSPLSSCYWSFWDCVGLDQTLSPKASMAIFILFVSNWHE